MCSQSPWSFDQGFFYKIFSTEGKLWYDIRYEICKNALALLQRDAQECQKVLQKIRRESSMAAAECGIKVGRHDVC